MIPPRTPKESSSTISRIWVVTGDITKLQVDAIVTAANEALVGGHGVDGAVHRAAGSGLFEECRTIGYCPEGEARITKGYLLPARYVIHTVGPVWEGGNYGEAELLKSCYIESLKLAEAKQIKRLAFPCIATGAHEYPRDQACRVAVNTVAEWLASHELPNEVIFCCFEEADAARYRLQSRESGIVEELFLTEKHAVSRRHADFEDDGTSAWLYLTEADTRRIVADAWIYNRVAAPRREEVESFRPLPPPAAIGFASETARCEFPERHQWAFLWSEDGESVAVTKDGQAVACILSAKKPGYSRELVKDGPWGNVWSDTAFEQVFGTH